MAADQEPTNETIPQALSLHCRSVESHIL